MRLIDADELKLDLKWLEIDKPVYHDVMSTIDEIATVDTDPVKHGHWIEVQRIHEKDHTAICECSLCGDTVCVYDGQRAWNYCSYCGAKMNEVEDGKID